MNGLVQGIIIALVPIGVIQIGALIYFCGGVKSTLRNMDARVERLEDWRDAQETRHKLAGEGMQLL